MKCPIEILYLALNLIVIVLVIVITKLCQMTVHAKNERNYYSDCVIFNPRC